MELAEQHLVEGGIADLSLRALAREIGVSQTAPYRHFR
ncbi:MAG: TetR family transcriptional regulator, partial [Spongiibacter sp.]